VRPRLALAAAVAVAGLGGLGASEVVVPAGPAGAAADCSSGVIVAADFSPWVPDTVNSVCDPGLPPNAAQALVDTGFDPVGVSTYPPLAFICTIAGYPRGEDCSTTPPGNAYWSFWYANGATWTYSELGATALTPVAGSVEYWEFGGASASNPPTTTPAALRSSTSTTTTTPAPPATTPSTAPPASTAVPVAGTPAGSAGGSDGGGSGNGTSHSPTVSGEGATTTGAQTSTGTSGTPGSSKSGNPDGPSSTQAATGSTTRPSPSATKTDRGTGGSAQGPTIVNAAPVVAAEDSPGSSAPFALGAVGIAVLAGTGGLIAWRRRRTG
jgi:hypothetical protein